MYDGDLHHGGVKALRIQEFLEFRNMKSSFLTEAKSFKNEFLQSCVKHSPREQVRENSTNEISERFINQLEEQISFLREQFRNKDKIINSLINELSKNSEVTQTPVIVEKSNEIEKDLSNNIDKRNPKSENKQVIRKSNDTKTKAGHNFG